LEISRTERERWYSRETRFALSIFPLGSAKSLTYLEFGSEPFIAFDIDDFDISSLTNLRHLKFWNPSLQYLFLPRVTSKLVSLVVAVEDGQKFSFTHPCLSSLQSLTITIIPTRDQYRDVVNRENRDMELLESLSSLLPTLQDLVLLFYAFVASRVGCLARLRRLESLVYELRHPVRIIADEDPEAVLSKIFDHNPKPKIIFKYRPKPRFPACYGS
jgi:hypothetical protein